MIPDVVPLRPDGSVIWPEPDPASPFWCHGPTLVSFSGGRTSAYMLFCVLWAHGGALPDHVVVAFANTGKEREETLRFVHECSVRWNAYVHWVEYRPPPARRVKGESRTQAEDSAMRFELVGFNAADRTGEWFSEVIRRKRYLPNQDMRYCTQILKIEPMKHLMLALGFARWRNMVGLREDEPHRVLKQLLRNQDGKERYQTDCPLFVAGVVKRVVTRFWLGRNLDAKRLAHPLPLGFDLGLYDYEGNCDLCFLKGYGKKARIVREVPGVAAWWSGQEVLATQRTTVTTYAKRFIKSYSVADLVEAVGRSPEMAGIFDPLDEHENDAECGVGCSGDAAGEAFTPEAITWLRERMTQQLGAAPRPAPRRKVAAALADLFAEAPVP